MAGGSIGFSKTPASGLTFQKRHFATGVIDYSLYLSRSNGFNINSTVDVKINGNITPLGRTAFTSFDILRTDLSFFVISAIASAKPTDSIQFRFGGYNINLDQDTLKMWKQVIAGDPRDPLTPSIRARSADNLQVVGKYLFG